MSLRSLTLLLDSQPDLTKEELNENEKQELVKKLRDKSLRENFSYEGRRKIKDYYSKHIIYT